MAKPDPALLDSARYPFHTRIAARFGDLDSNQHFNNVALMSMLEEARVRFHRASGYFEHQRAVASMMVSMAVEFLGQGYYPDPLDVHLGVERVGTSSHAIAQLAMQGGRVICHATSTIVFVADDRPVPIGQDYRDAMRAWMMKA